MLRQGGYGGLQLGFILVPCYVLVDVRLAEALSARASRSIVVARVVELAAIRCVALLLDPYSFVIASIGIGLIWLVWTIWQVRRRQWLNIVIAAASVFASYILAYVTYNASIDTDSYVVSTIDTFRGAGVDLYVILVPSILCGGPS